MTRTKDPRKLFEQHFEEEQLYTRAVARRKTAQENFIEGVAREVAPVIEAYNAEATMPALITRYHIGTRRNGVGSGKRSYQAVLWIEGIHGKAPSTSIGPTHFLQSLRAFLKQHLPWTEKFWFTINIASRSR